MPASTVRADYDQLTQIARRFGTEADSIGRMNQGLKREVDVLRGGDWIGTGAKAFYAEMDGQVMPSLGRLAAAMSAAQQVTQKILEVIHQGEDAAASVLRGLPGPGGSAAPGAASAASGGGGGGGFLSQVGGFFEGIWEGAKGMVTGLVNVVLHPIDTLKGIGYAVTHPGELWDALKKPYVEDWQSGNYGRAIGRGVFEVAMFLIPGVGEAKAGAKTAEIAELASQVSKASKLAEIANVADDIARVSKAGELAEAASTLAAGARAAETALAASGDLAALGRATDAFAAATRALGSTDAVAALRAFESANASGIPEIVKAFGGPLGLPGTLPAELAGARVTDLGRLAETSAAMKLGERILSVPDAAWSQTLNALWLKEAANSGDVIKLVTGVENTTASLAGTSAKYGGISVYTRELGLLLDAGYSRVGDFLIPGARTAGAAFPTGYAVSGAAGLGIVNDRVGDP